MLTKAYHNDNPNPKVKKSGSADRIFSNFSALKIKGQIGHGLRDPRRGSGEGSGGNMTGEPFSAGSFSERKDQNFSPLLGSLRFDQPFEVFQVGCGGIHELEANIELVFSLFSKLIIGDDLGPDHPGVFV